MQKRATTANLKTVPWESHNKHLTYLRTESEKGSKHPTGKSGSLSLLCKQHGLHLESRMVGVSTLNSSKNLGTASVSGKLPGKQQFSHSVCHCGHGAHPIGFHCRRLGNASGF